MDKYNCFMTILAGEPEPHPISWKNIQASLGASIATGNTRCSPK
jgi:hypothetical protein